MSVKPVRHLFVLAAQIHPPLGGITSGPIGLGEMVTWRARHFGIVWSMTSKITEFERPRRFVDAMQRGPFACFDHEHLFEQHGATTTMLDVVRYSLPLGPLGASVDAAIVRRYLRHLLEARNRYIKKVAEASPR